MEGLKQIEANLFSKKEMMQTLQDEGHTIVSVQGKYGFLDIFWPSSWLITYK